MTINLSRTSDYLLRDLECIQKNDGCTPLIGLVG